MSAFDSHLDNYGDPGAGWANDEPDWQPDEDEEAEAAEFEEQRAFERWADEMISDYGNEEHLDLSYIEWLVHRMARTEPDE